VQPTTYKSILIADDHPLYRAALRQMLSEQPDLMVIAEAVNGQHAIEVCRRSRPELVLMDVRMPTMDGIAATREIKSELPLAIVLMLTAIEDPDLLSEALRAGAAGYVLKYATEEEIVVAIRRVLRGEFPINHGLSTELLMHLYTQAREEPTDLPTHPAGRAADERAQHPLIASLTLREKEVLRLIARGKTNLQIAEDLHVSLNTVKNHVRRVMTKLNVSDRTQAAVLAIESGLREVNGG
jgi:DNA-binding NarL/FixJ family response regulator